MYKDLIEIIKDVCLRYKGVRTFRYQNVFLNNAKNNYATLQVYLSDVTHHNLNISVLPNIFKMEATMYILDTPTKEPDSILEVQDNAYNAALNILAKLDSLEGYEGILSVYDYNITTISHYTDDDSAGVMMSVELEIPVAVNLCELNDNFNDEPYSEPADKEIDLPDRKEPEFELKKVKLPKNKTC